jgi:hypothetical protein
MIAFHLYVIVILRGHPKRTYARSTSSRKADKSGHEGVGVLWDLDVQSKGWFFKGNFALKDMGSGKKIWLQSKELFFARQLFPLKPSMDFGCQNDRELGRIWQLWT